VNYIPTIGQKEKRFFLLHRGEIMQRIWHPWWLWEDYKCGFYKDISKKDLLAGELIYRDFLGDTKKFSFALKKVLANWKFSCEHNLSNSSLNRIAYLGQASICLEEGLPCFCRGGFKLLSIMKQQKANELASRHLKYWLGKYGLE